MKFPLSVRLAALAALLFAFAVPAAGQTVTGLRGWNLYLDPGHSQNGNVGVYGYSEAHKVLRVGLALRELLLETTDIDTVYMSRTNDQQDVSLSQRVDHANTVGAAHFHSIHSNAAAPTANYVFVLWPQYGNLEEAEPNGGKRMAELMADDLGEAMRIPSRGGFGECAFYGVGACRSRAQAPKGSRNYVQSHTLMASELSEAGFHTNPTQNQRNMNADWKRLEARAMYWSILDYHGIARPADPVATGIVTDLETGRPVNGAHVEIGDAVYTTDTYASLFHRYSNDPDELANGFYYLDDVAGGTLPVSVTAEGYRPYAGQVTLDDTTFTFHDVALVSTVPPVVAESAPADGETNFRITSPITITFSRPMDTTSVRQALTITPALSGSLSWLGDGRTLVLRPDSLPPQTDFTIRIAGTAVGRYGDALDGDGDGTGGDAAVITFRSGFPDTTPPRLVALVPAPNATGVELRPVLTGTYDERIDAATLDVRLERDDDGYAVPGAVRAYDVGDRTAVTFFPGEDLVPNRRHRLVFGEGVTDRFGNVQTAGQSFRFTTGRDRFVAVSIDDFEGGAADWWAPQQSGSTVGIVTDSTGSGVDGDVVNVLTGSTRAFAVRFGWDVDGAPWLVREYLSGGAPRAVRFDDTYLLQAYVFGDGSGVGFRFAVDDGLGTSAGGHEVSPWYPVDWTGWRLVSWDLAADGTGTWIGDGRIDGTLRFDSIQLTYLPGSEPFGRILVDDLRIARREDVTVATEPAADLPDAPALHAAYPNPFNPTTTLRFDLPRAADVELSIYDVAGRRVATLAAGRVLPAGTHAVTWDADGLPSGVYLARLVAGGRTFTQRLVLVK